MRRSGRGPFFLRLVDALLHGLLQRRSEQVASGVQGMAFAGVEDLAVGGSLGEGVHFGNKGNGPLHSNPLGFTAVLKRHGRHERFSGKGTATPHLIADLTAYFQRHTPAYLSC